MIKLIKVMITKVQYISFFFDKNGRAQKDIDYTDHGNPKEHPQVPHEHKWDWIDPNNPKRSKTDD